MTTKPGYDALMEQVCVGFGLCGCIKNGRPLHVRHFIPSAGPVSADQFAEWVFLADNINPNLDKWQKLKGRVRQAFVHQMGSETVDATLLRWSDET